MLDLEAFAHEAHALSHEKGWYRDRDLNTPDTAASMRGLIHSELAEATECVRAGQLVVGYYDEEDSFVPEEPQPGIKPEGLPAEIADVVIRVLDYSMAFNSRDDIFPMYGLRKSGFMPLDLSTPMSKVAWIERMHKCIYRTGMTHWCYHLLEDCYQFAQYVGFDLDAAILLKHAYNKTRPHKHGNKAL